MLSEITHSFLQIYSVKEGNIITRYAFRFLLGEQMCDRGCGKVLEESKLVRGFFFLFFFFFFQACNKRGGEVTKAAGREAKLRRGSGDSAPGCGCYLGGEGRPLGRAELSRVSALRRNSAGVDPRQEAGMAARGDYGGDLKPRGIPGLAKLLPRMKTRGAGRAPPSRAPHPLPAHCGRVESAPSSRGGRLRSYPQD